MLTEEHFLKRENGAQKHHRIGNDSVWDFAHEYTHFSFQSSSLLFWENLLRHLLKCCIWHRTSKMLHLGQFPVKSIEPQNVSKIIILLTLTNFPHRAVIQISYAFSILFTFFPKIVANLLIWILTWERMP